MLSDRTVRKINDQIQDKLRALDHPFKTSEEKEEIRKDLIVLRDLLTPPTEKLSTETDSIVHEICEYLRQRRR